MAGLAHTKKGRKMKSYHKIYARKFRRKFYTFTVRVLTYFFVRVKALLALHGERLNEIVNRPFRPAIMKNQKRFVITTVSSAKDSLRMLGNPEPTSKDVAEALKGADKVRGDGRVPTDPRKLVEKAEIAIGLQKSLARDVTEADLARDEQEIADLTAKVEKLNKVQEEQKAAE